MLFHGMKVLLQTRKRALVNVTCALVALKKTTMW
jgi:hypothetical protein